MRALFLQTISLIPLIGKQKKWGDLRPGPADVEAVRDQQEDQDTHPDT